MSSHVDQIFYKNTTNNNDTISISSSLPQLIQTDIDSHKPSVEAINESATELGSERDPNIHSQLDDLNSRFGHIIVRSRDRKDLLSSLIDKLSQLQEEVSDLEDWMLPVADTLEAPDIMRQELHELASKLQVGWYVHKNLGVRVLGLPLQRMDICYEIFVGQSVTETQPKHFFLCPSFFSHSQHFP